MERRTARYYLLISLFLIVGVSGIWAQEYLPPKPKLETSVYDHAEMMSPNEAKTLELKLNRYNDTTSTQIVVVTVNHLAGYEVSQFAAELAHSWGVGQKGKDNGIVILVAKKERRMTIATGYGVEHLLTDALSRRVIEQVITPEFKQGNFYAGLDKGTTAIIGIMSGEYKGDPVAEKPQGQFPAFLIVLIFVVIMIILSRKNKGGGNNRGRRSGGFSLLDAIILSSAGRGGFGGGSFGGGSGSSGGGFGGGGFGGGFGGGGFGGGGASGSW